MYSDVMTSYHLISRETGLVAGSHQGKAWHILSVWLTWQLCY